MKNNIGIVKDFIANSLKDDYINNNSLTESKKNASDFVHKVRTSPILKEQIKVFRNLEHKSINNDIIASRYIDENISLFNKYTQKQILDENLKLNDFFSTEYTNDKSKLYESIQTLILSAAKGDKRPDIDDIHESFVYVLDHLKKEKKKNLNESSQKFDFKNFDYQTVLTLALQKFNNKYSNLNESDKEIISKLSLGGDKEKNELFESLKKETLTLLEGLDKNGIEDKINRTIDKIENLSTDKNSLIESTIELYELKTNLS